MKAIPKLEARNAELNRDSSSTCPEGKKTRESMKSRERESLTLLMQMVLCEFLSCDLFTTTVTKIEV